MRVKFFATISACALLGACASTYGAPELSPVARIADQLTAIGADRADTLAANGNFGAAAALYQTQLVAEPDNVELKYKLAEAHRLGGKPTQARTLFLEIAAVADWQARGLEGLGRVAIATGDTVGAQQAFQNATTADPAAWRSWLALAQLSDFAAEWDKADAHYAAALNAAKEPAVVHNNLGVSFMARGNPAEAAQQFRQALQIDPSLARARTNLDLAEAAVGQPMPTGDAQDSKDQARRLNNFAYVAEMQNRREDALRLYEAAVQQHPAFYAKAFNSLTELKRTPAQPDATPAPQPALPAPEQQP